MISQAAKDSLERIFFQAARTRLTAEPTHACDIVRAATHSDTERGPRAEMLVLTIASIAFRIVLLLQFADDEATRDYYVGPGADRTLRDAAMEVGNLCCGAINQQLIEHFRDLGMSTPYALSSDCMGYLDELAPGYVAAYDVTIEHAVRLRATLCVCASAPLDFVAQVADVHESAGELELF
ncbi:hypothetical protein [Trinickia acidisoli]|uniref:hypothetical protein n=1 Tax=Trinickia acidisoli TaxID=2767482 RepID=UPI001A8D2C54|nr:hypothetical protein [Trinickia acidisoli]